MEDKTHIATETSFYLPFCHRKIISGKKCLPTKPSNPELHLSLPPKIYKVIIINMMQDLVILLTRES